MSGIIVALEEDRVKGCHDPGEVLEHMPEVGHHAEPLLPCFDHEYGPVHSVMGRGDGVYEHIAESDLVAGPEAVHVGKLSEIAPCRSSRKRRRSNIDRDAEFPLVHTRMPDVVAVIMGYDDRIYRADVPAVSGKPLLRLYAGDPGVDQQSDSPGLDINAISAAA